MALSGPCSGMADASHLANVGPSPTPSHVHMMKRPHERVFVATSARARPILYYRESMSLSLSRAETVELW